MSFPSEEGWKVPRYFGSCGRLAVMEFAGSRLTEFANSEFQLRARLSAQLLKVRLNHLDFKTSNYLLTKHSPLPLFPNANQKTLPKKLKDPPWSFNYVLCITYMFQVQDSLHSIEKEFTDVSVVIKSKRLKQVLRMYKETSTSVFSLATENLF